jgi:hypothetical protein
MGRGLSERQRSAVAALIEARRPLDVTRELGPLIGMPNADSGRRRLLRAMRLLEARGLVRFTCGPKGQRCGWGAVLAEGDAHASGELLGADLHHARQAYVQRLRTGPYARGNG